MTRGAIIGAIASLALAACSRPATPKPERVRPGRLVQDVGDKTIRVLLSAKATGARIASPSGLMFTHRDGSLIARASTNQVWRVEHEGHRVRAVRPDGVATVWSDEPMFARPTANGLLSLDGKPYRGDVAFSGSDSGVAVVNVVKIDDYLRGVVPLEIGTTAYSDSAAVQAQAVTARSYAYIHLSADARQPYDLTAGTLDQVYGGVAVETPVSSEAVESTRTQVLKYAGRVVNAPYHSTCGGSTAAASEIWRSNDEPYLQRVSDRIPGSSRYYCDLAPRFRWTRTIEGPDLTAALAQYLSSYTSVPNRTPGTPRNITIGSHTPSGRVGTITITTDRGNFVVRGNDARFVLRPPGGEILNSTYFSVETTSAPDGSIARLTLHGMGYGHGVGMCQSGAIGRARAGQDYRTILRTYYPGTTVGPAE
jgi:stage II sporulation protein D